MNWKTEKKWGKIMKTKAGSRSIKLINQQQDQLGKKKTEITNTGNEEGNITCSTDIKRIIGQQICQLI